MKPLSKILVFSLLLSLMGIIGGCSSAPPPSPSDKKTPYQIYMENARKFYNRRAMKKALELYTFAAAIEPKNPEPVYQKGLCLFRMDRFKEAAAAFKETLKLAPDHYEALTWFWASVLVNNDYSPQVKKAIDTGITNLVNNNRDSAGIMLAAYQGYSYLQEDQKSIPALKKALLLAQDSRLKEMAASYLTEEIISEKDPEKVVELAEFYIKTYPEGRNADLAFRTLMYTKAKVLKDKNKFKIYLDKYLDTQNRSFARGVAYWYITQNWDLTRAEDMLRKNLDTLGKLEKKDRPSYSSDEEWESALRKEKADYLNLLASIQLVYAENFSILDDFILYEKEAQKRDIINRARDYLEEAISLNDRNEDAYFNMAKICLYESDLVSALRYLKRTLEISDRNPEAEFMLREVLKKYFNYSKNPREYFLEKQKTVNFTEITKGAYLADVRAINAAWGDYNKDGLYDLLLSGPRLFKNKGKGKFEEVTGSSGLALYQGAKGGVWGDFNRDGYQDIFLISGKGNMLLENNGAGEFVDMTDRALPQPYQTRTEAAAWGDYDKDGFLDLYLANYERPGTVTGIGVGDTLYRNKKDGTFEDVTQKAGIVSDEKMCGRDVFWADINGDGFLDIYVSNYRLDPNFVWINQKNGTFADEAQKMGVAGKEFDGFYGNTIGSAFGDVNGDGSPDIFVSNLAHPRNIETSNKSMLLMNAGGATVSFEDRIQNSGITFEENSAKPILGDIDNDGDPDLYVTSTFPGQKSHLYLNDGKGQFSDITWPSGTRVKNAWGCAFADIDNDGDLDLAVASPDGVRLFRNNLGEQK